MTVGEETQDWNGCFTAQSTELLGAEGLNMLNAGVKLKEHRGDIHTHLLSLCDTHTPAHSLCFSDALSQMNMLNAGKKLNTEGTHTHSHTHTLTFSLLR